MKNLSADIHSRTDVLSKRLGNSRRDKALPCLYQKSKSGFTLIELLVSISILATISIVGYVSMHSYTMRAFNSERMASMDTLKSSLNNYYQIKKTLPDPNTNRIYYDEKGIYMHSSTGSFGVSGHASRHWYSEDYANNFAFDPETKQFFGYGKLSDNSAFDIATALYVDTGIYKTYLDGTYEGGQFPSLVRAYHSSDFVSQDSTEFLPYDPFERKVTAKIVTWSGTTSPASVWIGSMNETSGTCPQVSPALSLTGELMTGDCIGVSTGSTALLHISDGSELSLGSTGSVTILELKDLRYKDSEDPVTSVLLKLMSGEVWAEAPHLREINENESEMQIYTDTALAAVRGTIFGVSIDPTSKNTNLSLAAGEIEVGRNPEVNPGLPLIGSPTVTYDAFRSGLSPSGDGFSTTATGGFVLSGSTFSMVVADGGKAISLTVSPPVIHDGTTTTPAASTGSIDSSTLQQKLHFIPFGLGYKPIVTDVSFTGAIGSTQTGVLSVTFQNPGADSYLLSFGTGDWDYRKPFIDTNPPITGPLSNGAPVMTITGAFAMSNEKRTVSVKLCYQNVCSAPYLHGISLGNTFSLQRLNYKKLEHLTCPDGQRQFGGFGCQPDELVAFAPYDAPGDIVMYDSRGGSLGFSTNRVIGSGSYTSNTNARYALNAIRGFTELKNSCVPVLNTTTMAFASATCASTSVITTTLNDLASKGFRFDVPNSFFDIPQVGSPAARGVLLENSGNTDYLKYDLGRLSLGDKFSIEVSVRGSALKRTDSTDFYLWGMLDNYIGLRRFYAGGNYYLGLGNTGNHINGIMNFQTIFPLLNDNSFYKIKTYFNGSLININTTKIEILDENNRLITSSNCNSSICPYSTVNTHNQLYIGSKYDNTLQWNDIINYVKIYK